MWDFVPWPPVAGPGTRAVGYTLRTRLETYNELRARRMRGMAGRWGWDLVRTWEEDGRYVFNGADRPEFADMVGELRRADVGVVLVPDALVLGWDAGSRFAMVRRIEAASGAVVAAVPRVGWLELGMWGR